MKHKFKKEKSYARTNPNFHEQENGQQIVVYAYSGVLFSNKK